MAVSFKKMIFVLPMTIIICLIFIGVAFRFLGYSTPIPASSKEEKAHYAKLIKEIKEEQQKEAVK